MLIARNSSRSMAMASDRGPERGGRRSKWYLKPIYSPVSALQPETVRKASIRKARIRSKS